MEQKEFAESMTSNYPELIEDGLFQLRQIRPEFQTINGAHYWVSNPF